MALPSLNDLNPNLLSVDQLEEMSDNLKKLACYCAFLAFARKEQASGHNALKTGLYNQLQVLFEALPENWKW